MLNLKSVFTFSSPLQFTGKFKKVTLKLPVYICPDTHRLVVPGIVAVKTCGTGWRLAEPFLMMLMLNSAGAMLVAAIIISYLKSAWEVGDTARVLMYIGLLMFCFIILMTDIGFVLTSTVLRPGGPYVIPPNQFMLTDCYFEFMIGATLFSLFCTLVGFLLIMRERKVRI